MENKRRFITISGHEGWCIDTARTLLGNSPYKSIDIICCGIEKAIFDEQNVIYIDNSKKRSEIENHLGSEYSVLIFNCFSGFNPDLFCALVGLIKSPGFILLVTPNLNNWSNYPDPDYSKICSHSFSLNDVKGNYISYIIQKLNEQSESNCFFTLIENDFENHELNLIKADIHTIFNEEILTRNLAVNTTSAQYKIIATIEKLALESQNTILMIYGHRGRGKSTSIGLALQVLIQSTASPSLTICVISQNKSNVRPIFDQISTQNNTLDNSHRIDFFPPDEFLRSNISTDLLVIDEAAAISLTVLKKLVGTSNKVVIASTTDGYEGSGMGLLTKFQSYLSEQNRPIQTLELKTAHRWKNNDPIERFIFNTFLPQIDTSKYNNLNILKDAPLEQITSEKINREELVKDIKKVYQIFQLLAQAHYRTTPDDLRYMLDAPGVELWVCIVEDNVCAVLMASKEGLIDQAYERDIWLANRRLKGHLIPQALSSQSGFSQAIHFSYHRIVRIAVSAEYRELGIASKLITDYQASTATQNENLDFIGVSYGYDPTLFQFWQQLDFKPVLTGHRENARSGLKSILMLKPLTSKAKLFHKELENRFIQNTLFESKLPTNKQVSSNTFASLESTTFVTNSDLDKLDIYSFAYGNRQYANCQRPLFEFATFCINSDSTRKLVSDSQIKLLTLTVFQNKDLTQSVELLGLSGKKQLLKELKSTYAIFYNAVWGNKS